MNWTKLSAIAEIMSSVAILLTLVYLALQNQQIAFQTRQNTQALEASSRQGALDSAAEEGWIGVEGPVISDLSSLQGRKWWNRFGPGFEVSFRDHVDSLLEALPVKEQLEDVLAFD
jgi:hypothetical protein